MQSNEVIISVIIPLVSALLGGLVTRYVIRALEIKEREREGDFLALLYLRAAENHVDFGEKGGIGAMISEKWRIRGDNIVNGLIQSAAKSQKKYREVLYLIAKKMSKTSLEDYSFYISAEEIHSTIERMESDYFRIPRNN